MAMRSLVWIVAVLNFGSVLTQNVRLIPGPDRGRLEVLHNGTWGTVCYRYFQNQAATVVCRSLNQSLNNAYWVRGQKYGAGVLKPRLSGVSCSGQETSLSHCSLTATKDTTKACSSLSYVVGIVCTNEKIQALFKYGRNWFNSAQTLDIFEREAVYCYSGNDSFVRGFRVVITKGNTFLRSSSNSYTSYGPRRSDKTLTCTVSDWRMSNEDTLTIDVNAIYPPLEFVTSEIKVIEGATVNASLANMPNPVPYLTTWRRTGTRLQWNQTEAYRIYKNISRTDGGEFLVNITNQMNSSRGVSRQGSGLELVLVDVQYQPTVRCQQEYIVAEGSNVNITCDVDANPSPLLYIWTDNSGDIMYQGSKPSLVIASLKTENAGRYKCTAVNKMQDSKGIMTSGIGLAELSIVLEGDQSTTLQPSPESSSLPPVTYAMIAIAVIALVLVIVLVVVIVKLRRNKDPEGPRVRDAETAQRGSGLHQNAAFTESDYTTLDFPASKSK